MQPVAHVRATSTEDGDWDCLAEAVTIRHGRDDGTSQPEADAATIEILGPPPPGADIGTPIQVYAEIGGVEYPRVAGTITDIAIAWDGPDAPVTQIIAVGNLARMGHILIDEVPVVIAGVLDDYTDGSGANPGTTVRGTVHYDTGGMWGSAPWQSNTDLGTGYSGLLYDQPPGDFDDIMTVNMVSPGSVGMWIARNSLTAENGSVTGYWVNFTPPGQIGIWVMKPAVSPLESAAGFVMTGIHTVRIAGAYTAGPTLTLTVSVDGVITKVITITDPTKIMTGPYHGPVQLADAPATASRIRSWGYQADFGTDMDGSRANGAIAAAGVPTDAGLSDSPGTIHIITLAPDRRPALELAHDAAEDGGGVLWETRAGKVVYADALHRDGTALTLALDPCTIPLDITWVKNLEGLVNDITLTYYEDVAGTLTSFDQRVWDEDSIAAHGPYATSLGTRIAGEGDAITRAARMLFAQAEPAWRVAGVGLHLELLAKMGLDPGDDLAMTGAILDLEMNDLVSVVGMPYGSPINPSYLFIEGWTETISYDTWHLDLAVSDFCQTGAAETWDELDSTTTWHTYAGGSDVTWDTLPCHPPPGA